MKKTKILMSALVLLVLQGCGGEDNSKKVNEDFEKDKKELSEPSFGGNNINFGPKYTGLETQAFFDVKSVKRVQAFLDSFVLVQSQEVNIDQLARDILGNASNPEVTGEKYIQRGTCGGTSLFSRKSAALEGAFDHRLEYLSYCTDKTGLTGHLTESGKITGYGDDRINYLMRFYDYQYQLEAFTPFTLKMGGEAIIDTRGSQSSQTLRQMFIYKSSNKLTSRYDGWKATRYLDGSVYDGKMYHPSYGWVTVSTEVSNRINFIESDGFMKPGSGTLKLSGARSVAYIKFQDEFSYTVEIDANNDGSVDYFEAILW